MLNKSAARGRKTPHKELLVVKSAAATACPPPAQHICDTIHTTHTTAFNLDRQHDLMQTPRPARGLAPAAASDCYCHPSRVSANGTAHTNSLPAVFSVNNIFAAAEQ